MADANILTWTVIPHSLDADNHPEVAVHFSPRLATAGTLEAYDEFVDWPRTVRQNVLAFTLTFYELNSENIIAGPMEAEILSKPNSDHWKWLFPKDTPVKAVGSSRTVRTPDPRTTRNYQSYSVRKFARHTESTYLELAGNSFQALQLSAEEEGNGNYRTRLASLTGLPLPRPTIAEIRTHFEPVNIFLPQTPTEDQKLCLERFIRVFDSWVLAGEGNKRRLEAQRRVNSYLSRLSPTPDYSGTVDVRLLFKPDVFRAVVDRVMVEMAFTQEERPSFPECETASGRVTASRTARNATAIPLADLIDHALFHRSFPTIAPQTPVVERREFHELVSMMSSHPVLFTHVGLAFDIRAKQPIPDPDRYPHARISVKTLWNTSLPGPPIFRYPRTAYQVFGADHRGHRLFLPCSRGEVTGTVSPNEDRIHKGVLDISDPDRFHLEIMDTHGDYFKTKNAEHNEAAGSPDVVNTDREEAAPKLRSCGLALARAKRKDKVEHIAVLNAQHAKDLENDNATFFAEDLTLGYRVDILVVKDQSESATHSQDTDKWKSLCLRGSTYELIDPYTNTGKPLPLKDTDPREMQRVEGIVQSGASQAVDASDSEYQLLETLFRWENWSLAAPLPVKHPPAQIYDKTTMPLRLRPTHKPAKGTLPALRFGYGYFVRCRAAFLDGSGLTLEECPDSSPRIGDAKGDAFRFTRLESVDTPVVLLPEPLDLAKRPGEHLANVVISESNESSKRYLIPPRVAPYLAYLHGKRDPQRQGAFGPYVWHDDGTFPTAQEYRGTSKANDSAVKSDPSEQNVIFARRPEQKQFKLKHPYYPDPAAQQAQISLLHRRTAAGKVPSEIVEFYDSPEAWPDARAFEIRLTGAGDEQKEDAMLKWGGSNKQLTVRVRKGRTATLIVSPSLMASSTPQQPGADLFTFAPALRDRLGEGAVAPQLHWLLISQTQLQLVHAVEKPLVAPAFMNLAVNATLGDPTVKLSGSVSTDVDSTGEFDVSASWTDRVDNAGLCDITDPFSVTHGHVHNERVQLTPFARQDENQFPASFDHAIGDTKYHEITYSISGKSRFASYFKDGSAAPGQPNHSERFTISDASCNRVLHVCNRAAPDVPKVQYLIPSFRWEDYEVKHGRIHFRNGGGVRVYLDSPWFSSGNGELLGVLLCKDQDAIPTSAALLVTQWGMDPVWDGRPVPETPNVGDFQNVSSFVRKCDHQEQEETSLSNLPLVEDPSVRVSAIGFAPKFDCERKLWYCDIALSPKGAYYPFVRFALARFQPNSLPGAHLSKVVTADFAQLAPDRWVTVHKKRHQVTVSVYGFTYRSSLATPHGSEMMIRVEERIAGMNNELCWIPAVDPKTGKEIVDIVRPSPLSSLERLNLLSDRPRNVQAEMSVWRTDFNLSCTPFATHRRVLVQELEKFRSDNGADGTVEECQRVVFADVLEV